ncbi:MAG: lytic transglycosylase domain-containing protein [Bdellovibrio sp.]|nr:lytic transglycosylase domain-containing protein [Bdellovibrio sp.]
MGKLGFVVLSVLTITLFQNFKFTTVNLEKYQVNEETRIQHAKELLGKKYKKSSAAKFEKENLLNTELLNIVETSLPKKYLPKSEKITKAILTEANKYNIDPVFLISVIKTESAFNPVAVGTSGEIGLMQLMPKTGEYIAKKVGMKNYKGAKTLRDPVKNIKLGAAYFNYLREKFANAAYKYVPAYNVGPGKVAKTENRKDIPKIYSERVLKHYEMLYKRIYATQTQKAPVFALNYKTHSASAN